MDDADDEYARLETLHTLPRNRRHREFNQFFKAMIRYMAESHNNYDVAYDMDKLGRFVPKEEPGTDETPLHRNRDEAQSEFHGMTLVDQLAWRKRVERANACIDAARLAGSARGDYLSSTPLRPGRHESAL